MAQHLRALATLPLLQEDPNMVVNTHFDWLTSDLTLIAADLVPSSDLNSIGTCSHAHTLHIIKSKILFFKGHVVAGAYEYQAHRRNKAEFEASLAME